MGEAMELTPYVIYGSTRWDDAWLTEQNLAQALVARHRVLYVEPPMTPVTPVRYGLRRETAGQAARLVRGRLRRENDIDVLSPIVLPPRSSVRARAWSAPLLAHQVRRAVRRLGIERPVAVTAQWAPGMMGAAGEARLVCLIKDWVEAGADLLGRDAARLAAERDALIDAADIVCATSPNLERELEGRGVGTALLRHGFHAELAASYDGAAAPDEYSGLPRPLLGYTGRIDDRLDFDVLDALAARFAQGSLILVGPVSPRASRDRIARLGARPNVHLLDSRPRQELPGYLVHLDCCLMPYRDSAWLHYGSPLKLWDYLYAGPPCVGSGCAALRDFPPPFVNFAQDPTAFCDAVERAVLDDSPDHVAQRREFALANSWDHRAAQLDDLVTALKAEPDASRHPTRQARPVSA